MSRLLDSIQGPADLKGLTLTQLKQLASEIRAELVETVMVNGGHLASNLGVVELTIALHRVFDSPRDKLLWDVGHQSYVHKLLTGRRERFATLRQWGGLSGFTEREESPHDPFGAGHASTSISAAVGMAIARDLAGEKHHVVAIIGDGALTGGMALEAISQAGHLGKRLIVVLNDNALAISPNVGAIPRLINRLRLDPRYHRAKKGAGRVMSHLPWGILERSKRLKASFKGLLLPTMLWEELGFTYVGPIDGHNLGELEEALRRARDYDRRPLLLHILTQKGKGYPPAETDPVKFHGVAPAQERENGTATYTGVFAETTLALFRQEPRLVAITAAMPDGTGLSLVAREFPQRVFNVDICEQHAVTMAAGLATQGFLPIVSIYSTFLQRAYDQVIHDVCLQNLPVIFAVDRGGIVGEDGKTHQGTFDLSYLGCVPNLVVAAPADENELRHLLYTAVKAARPFALRYPRGPALGVPLDQELRALPVGQGTVVREGGDLALLALGSTVAPSLEAASLLAREGVEAVVVNARFAKPLDASLILAVAQRTGRLVTVEENTLEGGFGSAVLGLLEREGRCGIPVLRLGLPDRFIEHGPLALLRARHGLDGPGIAQRVKKALGSSRLVTA